MKKRLPEIALPRHLQPRAGFPYEQPTSYPLDIGMGTEITGPDNPPGSGIYPARFIGSDMELNTKPPVFSHPLYPRLREFLEVSFNQPGTDVMMVSRFRISSRPGTWDGVTDDLCFVLGILNGQHQPIFVPNYSNGTSCICSILGMPFSRHVSSANIHGGGIGSSGHHISVPGPLFIAEEPPNAEKAFNGCLAQMLLEKASPDTSKEIPSDPHIRFARMYIGKEEIEGSPFADKVLIHRALIHRD